MEKQVFEYLNLLDMIREIDLEKNSKEDIRKVLDFIADELEKYVDLFNGKGE